MSEQIKPTRDECEHGNLKRVCKHCEDDETIRRLQGVNKDRLMLLSRIVYASKKDDPKLLDSIIDDAEKYLKKHTSEFSIIRTMNAEG